jgi:hypothetical protein
MDCVSRKDCEKKETFAVCEQSNEQTAKKKKEKQNLGDNDNNIEGRSCRRKRVNCKFCKFETKERARREWQ